MLGVETFVWCRLLVVVVGGNGEGAALSDGIFGGGRFFLGIPCLWGVPGGGDYGWVIFYGNLVVRLMVGCFIAKPRDN